ncbi:hypothetical protein SAMN05720765_1502, partial [Fibrobacter sp. UWH6]
MSAGVFAWNPSWSVRWNLCWSPCWNHRGSVCWECPLESQLECLLGVFAGVSAGSVRW